MKFCATIAEYNPLHLGHLMHLNYIRNTLHAENIIVIMSGNFTQRGEPAVINKFKRAKQAIIAGADIVIELPTVFATSNAEIFARGAINVLNGLGIDYGLCFGVESGIKQDYYAIANELNDESKEYKKAIKDQLEKGLSLGRAKYEALKSLGGSLNDKLISSPNNILGVEYTKSILKTNPKVEIFPMERIGNHNDLTLKKGITSASSIREVIKTGKIKKIKKNLPSFVYEDINGYPFDFDKIVISKLITESPENISKIKDCTEGLENRLKALVKGNTSLDSLINKAYTKRYSQTRIKRILIANLLGIDGKLVDDCLNSPLYAKVLAVSKNNKDIISLIKENSTIPVLTRKSDVKELKKTALNCFDKDVLSNDLYNLVSNENTNENQMIIV